MLDTTMYIPPKETRKMTRKEVTKHALHWARVVAEILAGNIKGTAYLAKQVIPRNYVQIRREPETGDEWLHYGTRWLNANITDTQVKLAPRAERLEQEYEDLATMEKQLETMKKVYADQCERIKALDIQE